MSSNANLRDDDVSKAIKRQLTGWLVRLQPQARMPGNAAKHPTASADNLRALAQETPRVTLLSKPD